MNPGGGDGSRVPAFASDGTGIIEGSGLVITARHEALGDGGTVLLPIKGDSPVAEIVWFDKKLAALGSPGGGDGVSSTEDIIEGWNERLALGEESSGNRASLGPGPGGGTGGLSSESGG